MRNFLIATHGNMAEGIKSSLQIIIGDTSNITTINAFIDEIPLHEKIDAYFKTVSDQDEIFIFTDIVGGSVNQAFLPYLNQNRYLISGVNLALVLSLVLINDEGNSIDIIKDSIQQSTKQIVFMNEAITNIKSEVDEGGFF